MQTCYWINLEWLRRAVVDFSKEVDNLSIKGAVLVDYGWAPIAMFLSLNAPIIRLQDRET